MVGTVVSGVGAVVGGVGSGKVNAFLQSYPIDHFLINSTHCGGHNLFNCQVYFGFMSP